MKASEANFLAFLKKSPQFTVPIYQRTYSWTERECRQLWDDILRSGGNGAVSAHFVGSIVYIESGLYQVTKPETLLVIDGQQRLTTVSLLLEALTRHLGDQEPVHGFSAQKLRNYYLLNPDERDQLHFKLLLTQTDKSSLLALVRQQPVPDDGSVRIKENFAFFDKQVRSLGTDLVSLCMGLAKLLVVDISLNRDHDNPQLIFESMNSTGRELSQADLIRNFVLMGLDPDHQTALYEEHWRPMEVAFGQEAYGTHFDSFMRHYLTLKTGEIPNVGEVYEAFKAHARSPVAAGSVDALVADIHHFAKHYCAMALGRESDKDLSAAFLDLRELKVDVAYPFLLELYDDYAAELLTKADVAQIVRLVEAYVFRRAVCTIPTNSLNKTFATFGRAVKKDRYLESVKAHLLLLPSYRRFPSDDEFSRELQRRDLYNFRTRSYWMRRMENHGRKERVEVNEYTIEHIMPQNENLSSAWRTSLGKDWKRVQQTYLHTLGNLTLTGYNAEYSDRPFVDKRDRKGGFKETPIRLSEGLGALQDWNETQIVARAERIARVAIRTWEAPVLAPEVVANYQPTKAKFGSYSIEHHPHLAAGSVARSLFEAFRSEVLALDPSVTEEYLKLYVAYKAETNFVDVVPQAKRLRLSLNMQYHEIHDPKAVCRDVTGLGRWGNGDVEVSLDSLEDLPYVMGLVRQSLETQLGSPEVLQG